MKKVAIIGTQGVPAQYGGFESLVENIIGDNCSAGIAYTVFCSSLDKDNRLKTYKGCRLKYVPLHANGVQSIPYDMLSMLRALKGYDTLLILGTSGCLLLPFLKILTRSKIVINIDGLEHRREKWGKVARWMLRHSEQMAVRYADVIIADNKGISDYVTETYGKSLRVNKSESLTVQDLPLSSCDVVFTGVLEDAYQRTMTTEQVEMNIE